jgi:hypothetical protein
MFKISVRQTISFLVLFASFVSYSQTHTITGVVSDDSNIPLENANVIAKPLQEKASLKFAIADNKGRYRLELDNGVKYEITVSYISFLEEVLFIEADSNSIIYDFKLKATGEKLKEIVIKHDFKPLVIKKDTLIYDVNSFTNGNERKMKEILEKLPGIEVDKKGNVTVQGKRVTQMLVEGKSFFGGGSKLAVENIPADALDKIEVIDNFNEVGFMKQVSDSDDLAMNIKLKESKKKFVFGDLEVGLGNDKYNLAHAALFYYAPKINLSFIGDINNIGKSTFTFDDLIRFGGGFSSFISERKSFTNLYSFTNDNQDFIGNKSQFGAFNFSYDTSSKFSISGFGIFSNVFTNTKKESVINYLENSTATFENKLQKGENSSILAVANVKMDYSPHKKEKWYYNAQYQSSTNDLLNTINSITNLNSSVFETISKADNNSAKQYIEWHKSYNSNHTTTLVVNQSYEDNSPTNHWFTNEPFFTQLIPLQKDSTYVIEQVKKVKNNSVDALFKYYWVINNFNHIYTSIGNNYGTSNFITSEKQVLTNGTINDFASSGYGNNIKYQLNDAYIGLEYKFRWGKWTNKPGLYLHWYSLITDQQTGDYSLSKTLFQPQWNSDYEFNKSEILNFTYKLVNDFPEANQMANRYTLEYYNLVFKGNALLDNERYHSANLRYSKMNTYRGIIWNGKVNFNKKEKTIRNEIQIEGINQYTSPVMSDNPETNYSFNGSFSKRIYRFSLKINTDLNWFNYSQTLNSITTLNRRNNQNLGISCKTAYKKWPDFSIGYTKGYGQFSGITKSKYQTDAINSDLEVTFLKCWIYKFEYENLKNTNDNNQSNFYEIANTSLAYQKKNNPFRFELSTNNLFNIQKKNFYSFSDYMISNQSTFILPRVFLFSVSYKL